MNVATDAIGIGTTVERVNVKSSDTRPSMKVNLQEVYVPSAEPLSPDVPQGKEK